MSKAKSIWECSHCGNTQPKWSGSCEQCKSWNSFVEQIVLEEKKKRFEGKATPTKALRIKEIDILNFHRVNSEMRELDRLLGGGIVNGSLILLAGDPGIGKSTLLLQISNAFAKKGLKVLYICGEESVEQTSLRARRLNIDSDNLFLLNETNFSAVKLQIDNVKPNIIMVDSVQILYKEELPSAPGSVVQVREIATEFMQIAKGSGITTFLIGHVTKSGEIAGPRVLEHIVDTVLEFEGDRQLGFRLLRSVKNRFGPTDDIAIFQMKEKGLEEIANPSEAFLQERLKELTGSVIVPTVEGARSILIEVQALVSPSPFATPSRKCSGLDPTRLSLLLAVLEKRVGYKLHNCDVFVSLAGGMHISEPAIDLGVVIAIASSFANKLIDSETVVLGEVGLGGEVRGVPRIESRVKEALNIGFKKCIVPKRNLVEISKSLKDSISIKGVELVDEAIYELI